MSGAADLLLHLKPCPVTVDFLGRSWPVPARDCVAWLELIAGDEFDPWAVFPALAGQDAVDEVSEALWRGVVELDDVVKVAMEVVSAVADRPWWVALRIIGVATGSWETVHVNDAVGRPLAGWLDEVWSKILAHVDPKKRASFVNEVESAPTGWQGEVDFNNEEMAFMSAMKAVMK